MKVMKKEEDFKTIILDNKNIKTILKKTEQLNLPNWYLCAGCLAHTVWNTLSDFEIETGIKDYDVVYFDRDTSYEKEDEFIVKGKALFRELGVNVEIRNEARVHLWYESHFGRKIKPYRSVEEAIKTFPTTATAIGVRQEKDNLKIFAPFGLDDLLEMVIKPNKAQITEKIYLAKVNRWSKIWPDVKIIPW